MATDAIPFASPIDSSLFPSKQWRAELLAADPTGAGLVPGRLWLNTTTGILKTVLAGAVVSELSVGGGMSQEQIEDIAGAMVLGNTETDITVTYDDAAVPGKLNFAVFDFRPRGTHTGTQLAATISDFSAAADARIALVVAAAPAALDTLNELAAALGNDANFAATIATQQTTQNTNISALQAKFPAPFTLAAGQVSPYTWAHGLGTADIDVRCRYNDGDRENFQVIIERPIIDDNNLLIRFGATTTRPVRVLPSRY